MISADLHETYGVDVDDRTLMRDRPWPWLQARILGLLDRQSSRLSRAVAPQQQGAHVDELEGEE